MIDIWLEQISAIIRQSMWLAPVLALLAYVGGVGVEPKKALRLSLVFALGAAITFTALGVIAASIGRLIGSGAKWWYVVLGVLMVLMALQTWGIINFIPSTYLIGKNKRRSYLGALIAGILGGVFSSPCSTPVLIALLAIVGGSGNILWGILLLLLYSVGHGALAIFAGTSVGFVQKMSSSAKYGRFSAVLKTAMGILILIIGFYMFYIGF
jgi:cytochrome c biogenesis protein CcdA